MRIAILLAGVALPHSALGQTAPTDARIAAAERAASEAEHAAALARQAMIVAEEAARAARAAAAAQRIAGGDASMQSAVETPGRAGSTRGDAAQNLRVPDASAVQKAETAIALSASVANGPNEGFLKSSTTPDLQVIASDKDKIASIAWTIDLSRPTAGTLSADQLTVTASGKFDGETDTGLLGLNGFADGNEVKIKYIHFGGRTNLTGAERGPVAEARRRCERATGDPALCNPYAGDGVGRFMAKYNPEGYGTLLDEVLPGPVWFAGLEFAGNQAWYKYLDRASFSVEKEDHFGFAGSVFGGLLFNRGRTAVTASYSWRREYEAADPITLCQPVPGTSQSQCITAANGAPERGTGSVVGLELRHAVDGAPSEYASLAVAPEINYDLDSTAWSVELPLYFAGDGNGKLRGGVRLGYLNERDDAGGRQDEFSLGLFVGVPFSLFAN